jgi:CRP-like cAMP-binding protein
MASMSHEETVERLDQLHIFHGMQPLALSTLALVARQITPHTAEEEAAAVRAAAALQLGGSRQERHSAAAGSVVGQLTTEGRILVRQHSMPRSIYLLLQGTAKIVHNEGLTEEANNFDIEEAKCIATIAGPTFFGESALVHNSRRMATVVASDPASLKCLYLKVNDALFFMSMHCSARLRELTRLRHELRDPTKRMAQKQSAAQAAQWEKDEAEDALGLGGSSNSERASLAAIVLPSAVTSSLPAAGGHSATSEDTSADLHEYRIVPHCATVEIKRVITGNGFLPELGPHGGAAIRGLRGTQSAPPAAAAAAADVAIAEPAPPAIHNIR